MIGHCRDVPYSGSHGHCRHASPRGLTPPCQLVRDVWPRAATNAAFGAATNPTSGRRPRCALLDGDSKLQPWQARVATVGKGLRGQDGNHTTYRNNNDTQVPAGRILARRGRNDCRRAGGPSAVRQPSAERTVDREVSFLNGGGRIRLDGTVVRQTGGSTARNPIAWRG